MRVTIIGTGNMGRAIAARVLAGGHAVSFVGTYIARAQELSPARYTPGPWTAHRWTRLSPATIRRPRTPSRGTRFASAIKVVP
ncbi:MAG TPA: NAD(P)-binding domain-containing protein [Solirubrobacteraceae bacterium]|jgi:hypothetical protein